MNTTKCIGCEVADCMYNKNGKHCSLDNICVGNDCSANSEFCTCCKNYRCKI